MVTHDQPTLIMITRDQYKWLILNKRHHTQHHFKPS